MVAQSAVHVPLFSDTIIKLRISWLVLYDTMYVSHDV
jgi:hypothetical protein